MTGMWRTWMTTWCIGVALFGVLLVMAGFETTATLPQLVINAMHGGVPVALDAPLRFGIGLQGALSIGLALLVYAGATAATELGPRGRPIWMMVTTALLLWYVIDSAISCANGFTLNAVSNTLVMLLFLVPVLASGVLRQPA